MKENKESASKMEDRGIFRSVSPKKGQKRPKNHQFSYWPKSFAQNSKSNPTMISYQKISKFYHTLRKSWQLNVSEGFGPHRSPFYVKKIFISDSAQISCVKSLGHKDLKSWVSSKSETKKFFFQRGDPLMFFWFFKSQFPEKSKGGTLLRQKFFCLRFWWNSRF